MIFIARLLREFYHRAGGVYGIPYDHESMLVTVDDVTRHGVCVIGPTSCAGAVLAPFPSNCEKVIAQVVFWSFVNKREIEIFNALAKACSASGATHINASSHFPDNVIGRFYAKHGLVPTETQYLGKLETCCKPKSKAVCTKT